MLRDRHPDSRCRHSFFAAAAARIGLVAAVVVDPGREVLNIAALDCFQEQVIPGCSMVVVVVHCLEVVRTGKVVSA